MNNKINLNDINHNNEIKLYESKYLQIEKEKNEIQKNIDNLNLLAENKSKNLTVVESDYESLMTS